MKENNAAEQQKLMTEKRIHKLWASAFFDCLWKKKDSLLTASFD